jgi:hypothetical protein
MKFLLEGIFLPLFAFLFLSGHLSMANLNASFKIDPQSMKFHQCCLRIPVPLDVADQCKFCECIIFLNSFFQHFWQVAYLRLTVYFPWIEKKFCNILTNTLPATPTNGTIDVYNSYLSKLFRTAIHNLALN